MSIHQAKGREADTVILDLGMSGATYNNFLNCDDDEHRVWYVGVSRARERLYALRTDEAASYLM